MKDPHSLRCNPAVVFCHDNSFLLARPTSKVKVHKSAGLFASSMFNILLSFNQFLVKCLVVKKFHPLPHLHTWLEVPGLLAM